MLRAANVLGIGLVLVVTLTACGGHTSPSATRTAFVAITSGTLGPTPAVASPTVVARGVIGTASSSPLSASPSPVSILPADPQALPNFTLTERYASHGLPTTASSHPDTGSSLTIEQASPDTFHIAVTQPDGGTLQAWLVTGTSYLDLGQGITTGTADDLATLGWTPQTMVATLSNLTDGSGAQPVGTETIAGRSATHYHLDASDYVTHATAQDPSLRAVAGATNIGGSGLDYWIDDAAQIQLKHTVDVTFTTSEGTPVSIRSSLEITQIGTTPPVTAPQ